MEPDDAHLKPDPKLPFLRERFPEGAIVRGVVKHHAPFGIFLDLADPDTDGLVRIPDFKDEGRMTPEEYPPLGSEVEAYVYGVQEVGYPQVILSLRPSLVRGAV